MKQVSIIIPKDQNPEKPVIFLGALYLASYLKQKGIPVKIYDEQMGQASKSISEIIDNSFLVGFTVMTSQLKSANEISLKVHKAGIPVAWGGCHPLLFPEQCLKEDYVDYVIFDEGEETLYEVAQKIKSGIHDLSSIHGLWLKKEGKFIKSFPRGYVDINEIHPDWRLIDLKKYYSQIYYDGNKKDAFPLHVGRGCPYRCSFCIQTLLNKRQHRGLTAENIIREVKRAMKAKHIECVSFVDDNFFLNLDRVKEFCRLYKKEGFKFKWAATARVTYILRMDDNFLKELKDCGCVLFRMGVESGSQRVLDELIHKDIKRYDVLKAIRKVKKFGISMECSFMVGLPGETVEEQKKTFKLIKKIIRLYDKVHIIGPQLYRPYPGAEMYEKAKKMGFKEPKSVDEWISFLNNFGFLDISNLTWIPNKDELLRKCKCFAWSQIKPKGLAMPLGLFFRTLFRLRMKADFYHFGIDLWLYEKIKNIYIESVKNKE